MAKHLRRIKEIGSRGAVPKPTNQFMKTMGGGRSSGRGRTVVQSKELTTVKTVTNTE